MKRYNNNITPVVLAGGSGTRLWPFSRKSYPKQFSKILGSYSLFQNCLLRLKSSNLLKFKRSITLTNASSRFLVAEQYSEIGEKPDSIFVEPEAKNTAPAVLAATFHAMKRDPDAIILVSPSDHVIPDNTSFQTAIADCIASVTEGKMVTFGVKPTYPETGYGYLELKTSTEEDPIPLKSFVEKPNLEKAKVMLASGNFFWNAGIFLFRGKDMIKAFEKYAPDLIKPAKLAVDNAKLDLGFLKLDNKHWADCESVSVDYAIMEKATNLVAMRYNNHWSDLGSWESVWKEQDIDGSGLVEVGNVVSIDCQNTLLRSESEEQLLVGLGLEGIIAVAMPDAILVANKNQSQEVKKVVDRLKDKNVLQAEDFTKDYRPWGWFETLVKTETFQVKQIMVKAGESLSLQSHKYRSEHWVVVEGTAKITIETKISYLNKGESTYIPLGAKHRLENTKKVPLFIIEVQLGSYLGEDDIVRYDDKYMR